MREDQKENRQEKRSHNALHVQQGLNASHDGRKAFSGRTFIKRDRPKDIEQLKKGILAGNNRDLARAITLIESSHPGDQQAAQKLLQQTGQNKENTIRIGISGVPGAGKSTFIDVFASKLCEEGLRVAVLAIDPSSTVSGGSVLGDKTRMEKLVSHPNAFIRPSPTSGTLGGVHRKTRESMQLCEAAGYDILLVETVGVGQSEIAVRNMVDFFMLLVLTGAGDDLQGMKKGIMEMTDLIIVHKADRDNVRASKRTVREYKRILHQLQPATPGWQATALPVSSIEYTGHADVWEQIRSFKTEMEETGFWAERRKQQIQNWFQDSLEATLIDAFYSLPGKKEQIAQMKEKVLSGEITVSKAIKQIFNND